MPINIDNVLKAALEIAFSNLPIPVPQTLLNHDEKQRLGLPLLPGQPPTDVNRLKKIREKLLQEYQKKAIVKHAMRYDRHASAGLKAYIYMQSIPGQSADIDVEQAQFWYRAMEQEEFLTLHRKRSFVKTDSYGGIATCRDYSRKYMTNDSEVCVIVEWHIPPAGRLYELMNEKGIRHKSETGAKSYGLGETGTNNNLGPTAAYDVFDTYCGPTYSKITDLRITIPDELRFLIA